MKQLCGLIIILVIFFLTLKAYFHYFSPPIETDNIPILELSESGQLAAKMETKIQTLEEEIQELEEALRNSEGKNTSLEYELADKIAELTKIKADANAIYNEINRCDKRKECGTKIIKKTEQFLHKYSTKKAIITQSDTMFITSLFIETKNECITLQQKNADQKIALDAIQSELKIQKINVKKAKEKIAYLENKIKILKNEPNNDPQKLDSLVQLLELEKEKVDSFKNLTHNLIFSGKQTNIFIDSLKRKISYLEQQANLTNPFVSQGINFKLKPKRKKITYLNNKYKASEIDQLIITINFEARDEKYYTIKRENLYLEIRDPTNKIVRRTEATGLSGEKIFYTDIVEITKALSPFEGKYNLEKGIKGKYTIKLFDRRRKRSSISSTSFETY